MYFYQGDRYSSSNTGLGRLMLLIKLSRPKTQSFFHPPTLVAPFGRGIPNREGRWNIIPIWPAMLVDPSLAAWCWFFLGWKFFSWIVFPLIPFFKNHKNDPPGKFRENLSPSQPGKKTQTWRWIFSGRPLALIQLSTHIPVPTWLMMRLGALVVLALWVAFVDFLVDGEIKGKPHTNAAGSEILWGRKR